MNINQEKPVESLPVPHHHSAVMSKRVPSYEKRERWMAVISASFHPLTIFQFARHRALEAADLIDELEQELVDLERRLNGYIPSLRLLAFWRGVYHMLETLCDKYYNILKRVANHEWTWWKCEEEDRRMNLRIKKQSMIKHLAVYDWILSILQIAIKCSFEESRPRFLSSWPRTCDLTSKQRRISCPEMHGLTVATETSEIVAVELSILRWTQSLENELRSTILDLHHQYNKGEVLEHYVVHLQWTNEQERKEWEEDNAENGQFWPYPDDSLKPEGLDIPGSKSQERHCPVGEVPTWQEDEELQVLFS